ncbi:MAG: flagellar biosynthesis anti-sigma factor FlgM [Lautropia sp.]
MMIGKPSDVGATPPTQRSNASSAGARAAVPVPTQAAAGGEQKVVGAEAADSVQLSDASRAMINADPGSDGVRADKVAAIKKAIEEGTYHVQAQKIADALIKEASELLESLSASK